MKSIIAMLLLVAFFLFILAQNAFPVAIVILFLLTISTAIAALMVLHAERR